MPGTLEIRDSNPTDTDAIASLYPLAFPDEDLVPLVRSLLSAPEITISLVATNGRDLLGHVMFTTCGIVGSNVRASMLAPLAVAPAQQRRGIGTALVREGLQRLRDNGTDIVFVLGDPAYYSRHGFNTEARVQPPYPLPAEWYGAWQSQCLGDANVTEPGRLAVPAQWLDPALWAP
ncbi:MAG: N-acetyltransferase [Woeseiaceae bacterium]|nr:N-acetyltransferase [Woeseiaceae bacterium]